LNEEEEGKKKSVLGGEGTGTTVPHLARAVPRFWNMRVGFCRVRHGRALIGTACAKSLAS